MGKQPLLYTHSKTMPESPLKNPMPGAFSTFLKFMAGKVLKVDGCGSEGQRGEPLGGFGSMLPQKMLNLQA